MPKFLRELLQPLNLAGLCTLAAVGLSLRWADPSDQPLAWTLLLAFTASFLVHDALAPRRPWLGTLLLCVQPLLGLALVAVHGSEGTAQVLLVIWTAHVAMEWPPRRVLAAVALVDLAVYGILVYQGHGTALVVTLLYAGFQAFAALVAHYARTAERARDQLALVNADLLATRALLADSARDGERLRMARELHDVAGHKLTAMRLNLRALASDPAFAGHEEVRVAERLSAELLGDLRGIVQALRDSRGLDLETAIRALAAPLPRPALSLHVDEDVRVDDPAVAEALLRLVQEALTNAARHADADTLRVELRRDGDRLRLVIEDDGRLQGVLREGNGIAGMRERIVALRGELALGRSAHGALRIDAVVPA